jgi:hypothetical protein
MEKGTIMEIGFFRKIITSQIGASIKMLENSITSCSDELWTEDSLPLSFWNQVYHVLFYLDLYLSESETTFVPPPQYKPLEAGPNGPVPQKVYSRKELMEYLEYNRTKANTTISSLTDEKAHQKCGFDWIEISVAELFLYNIRHVQHHAAQLNRMLRLGMNKAPGWVPKTE